MAKDDIVLLGDKGGWADPSARRYIMDIALGDADIVDAIEREIRKGKLDTTGFGDLINLLQKACEAGAANPDRAQAARFETALERLTEYYRQSQASRGIYKAPGKPTPSAVFWPNPNRDKARHLETEMPIIEKFSIIDRQTPIGSAGSCFAFRISHQMQRNGFNYVISEAQHDRPEPVFLEEGGQKDGVVNFCANWGLLFNSPSFTQLVERAFGEREFRKLLMRMPAEYGGYYVDPYREGVGFRSPGDYARDYEKHLAAIRDAMTRCKAFVVTLGLNECWELIEDGTTLSRNPRFMSTQVIARPKRLTVAENIKAIRRFAEIVRAHNPDFKLIVSVSPIPFLATTRGEREHVVTANAHSKAVLRVAAEEIVEADSQAYYFPSYELITSCLANPWEDDLRHVTDASVDRVMEMFEAAFIAEE